MRTGEYLLAIFYGFDVLRTKEGHLKHLLAAQEQAIERNQANITLIRTTSLPSLDCVKNGKNPEQNFSRETKQALEE